MGPSKVRMLSPVLPPPPRTRKELINEFPLLLGAGHPRNRVLDECLQSLAVFHHFGQDVASYVEPLDALAGPQAGDALASVLGTACHHRIFSLAIPKSLGGSGCSMLALSIGLEHLSQLCVGIANVVAAHGLALALVGASGHIRVLRHLAHRIVDGERTGKAYLLATAATEPSAGSDLEDFDAMARAQLQSHADLDDGVYALHGRKIFVSNGSIASAYVVVMPTERARARDTLSAFLVHAGTPGLTVTRIEDKLGQRACPAAELEFDGCRVAEENRLNAGSIAGRTLELVLGSSRATVGAFGAGIARGVFETSRRLARRFLGDDSRPMLDHPSVQTILARLWTNSMLARGAYLDAAQVQQHAGLVSLMESELLRTLDRFVPSQFTHGTLANKLLDWGGIDREARRILARLEPTDVALASAYGSATKICTSELALANCELALELFGVEATREDSGIPKYWRDARLLRIYEGTNEVCALNVAKNLVGVPS